MGNDHPHYTRPEDRAQPQDVPNRQPPISGWRCTAPPGVTEWHPGIPAERIYAVEHYATAMRLLVNELPHTYRHLVTNYRYDRIGPTVPTDVEPCSRCGGDGKYGSGWCKRCAGCGDEPV